MAKILKIIIAFLVGLGIGWSLAHENAKEAFMQKFEEYVLTDRDK